MNKSTNLLLVAILVAVVALLAIFLVSESDTSDNEQVADVVAAQEDTAVEPQAATVSEIEEEVEELDEQEDEAEAQIEAVAEIELQ